MAIEKMIVQEVVAVEEVAVVEMVIQDVLLKAFRCRTACYNGGLDMER